MDALSDVLRIMRLKGGVFLHGEFFEPWCVYSKVKPQSCARYLGETAHVIPYHFVIEGRMRVRFPDNFTCELGPGKSVMFPHNDPHILGSDTDLSPVDSDDVIQAPIDGGLATISLGKGGKRTRIVCGYLGTEDIRGNPVLSALPAALCLNVRDGSAGVWIETTFHHAANQIAAGRLGSEVLMSRLSELLFVEAIQRYAETLPEQGTGWLAGLKDPYVARALALLHSRIGEPWTVQTLGREVGLSRSALAERFGNVLGMAPMQYLANWRIHVAAHELVNSHKSILKVAEEVGYESEASFTRAFKRVMAVPPGIWRRERGQVAPGKSLPEAFQLFGN